MRRIDSRTVHEGKPRGVGRRISSCTARGCVSPIDQISKKGHDLVFAFEKSDLDPVDNRFARPKGA